MESHLTHGFYDMPWLGREEGRWKCYQSTKAIQI